MPEAYHVGSAFIQVLPSFRGFHRRTAAEMAKLRDIRVEVQPHLAPQAVRQVQAELARVAGTRDKARVRVDADTAAAHAKLSAVDRRLRRIGNSRTDITMEADDASRAIAVLGGLVVGISTVGATAPAAAAAVALIPAALAGAGQGITALVAGFNGVGDAVTAMQKVDDEAVSAAITNARQRESAAARVARAVEQADRAAVAGARQVIAARDAVATAQETAARRTADAERALARVQVDARDAQEALNRARAEARERIEDMHLSLARAALDEQAAVLALERARQRLAEAQAEGVTGLDLAEAGLGVRQAEQALAEVGDRLGDLREQAAEYARTGVDGDAAVVAAHRQVSEAAERIADAEHAVAEARTDGARQVAQAQRQLADAQQQAAVAQADAARRIAEATRAAGDEGAAALGQLDLAMSKLTPQGQAFARFLHTEAKPALRSIGDAVQATLLPQMQTALGELLTLTPLVSNALAETGDVLGELAVRGAEMMTSGPWTRDFTSIASANNRMLGNMGQAGLSLADAWRSVWLASLPMAEGFTEAAVRSAHTFNTWIQGRRESGELAVAFVAMGDRLRELWEITKQVLGGFFSLASTLAPLGLLILRIVGAVAELVGQFAAANPILTNVIALAVLGGSVFVSLGRTIGGLFAAVRSAGVGWGLLRDRLVGARTAADATSAAVANTTAKTTALGAATTTTGGLLGRAKGWLDGVRVAYDQGATAAGNWANRMTGALVMVDGRISATASTFEGGMGRIVRVAGGTGSAVTKGLGSALTGLVGVMGGPWGLALAGVTVGLGFLAAGQAEAAQRAAEHKAKIQDLTQALKESHGAITTSVRAKIAEQLATASLIDNTERLGLSVEDLIDAVTSGSGPAHSFVVELENTATALLSNNKITGRWADELRELVVRLAASGGAARDHHRQVDLLTQVMQYGTGATDAQAEAFRQQVIQLLDLAAGYHNATADFRTATQDQQNLAKAHDAATGATDKQTQALTKLNETTLDSIDTDLAYRNALLRVEQAHDRTTAALADSGRQSKQHREALLDEEAAMLALIRAAGARALAESTATSQAERDRHALTAMHTEAQRLATTYGGTLPASIQRYVDSVTAASSATSGYLGILGQVPPTTDTTLLVHTEPARTQATEYRSWIDTYLGSVSSTVTANTDPARAEIQSYKSWFDTYLGVLTSTVQVQTPQGTPLSGLPVVPNAHGALLTSYARGGFHRLSPMAAGTAQIVPPNTWRVIGDRLTGHEAYIPIDHAARSQAILAETAARMGFALVPLMLGGLLGLARRLSAQRSSATNAPPAGGAEWAPGDVDALTAALTALVGEGLEPVAAEIDTRTAPAVHALDRDTGQLAARSTATATELAAAWRTMTTTSSTSTATIAASLDTLRVGLATTGQAFASTADWVRDSWARISGYAAGPVRELLSGPYNAGLIAAWNHIDAFFALGRHLDPVPIAFATGGEVPGVGDRDTVPALLTPGEYVISKPVVKKWGLRNIHAAHLAAKRGGFGGLEGMFTGDQDGIFRVEFASGGPVPEALARGQAFARSMHGKPYVWGGSSEAGTDCSGYMAMIARALLDIRPYARREWATGQVSANQPPTHFAPGIEGSFAIGVNPGSHTAGTLAGINVESGGRHGYVAYGGPAAGADHPQFPLHFHLPQLGGRFLTGGFDLAAFLRTAFAATEQLVEAYHGRWPGHLIALAGAALVHQAADTLTASTLTPGVSRVDTFDDGGWLPPGYSTVVNRTGRPEAVLTAQQWRALTATRPDPDGGRFVGELRLDSGQLLGVVRGEIRRHNDTTARALSRRTR